ncbi:ArsI/CadI family heavy metal resistance metalloenzyme [Ilumatobacter sp.]|uniref:ArsI/CadI family heavy metal resistance metalloenzyme n=1 Tax=Ilumatobacter sp. TaxID=1967498 RepID=UPI003C571311
MRLQLALNVTDLDTAIEFYSKMFDASPAKVRPGYANFAIADPPLKLVLFENADAASGDEFLHLNHLGVETEQAGEVVAAETRLSDTGLETTGVDDTVCCFAEKTETWVTSPEGAKWEWYVKTGDAEQLENEILATPACCS